MEIVTVKIIRNAHSIPRTVGDFEIPVLEQIFGSGNVQVEDSHSASKAEVAELLQRPKVNDDNGKFTLDTSESDSQLAWNLMQRRYEHSKDGSEALKEVYPSEIMFKRMFNAAGKETKAAA